LARTWRCEVHVHRGPRIVTVAENYDALGYEAVRGDARRALHALRHADRDAAESHLGDGPRRAAGDRSHRSHARRVSGNGLPP
jgi:hypothetical protein